MAINKDARANQGFKWKEAKVLGKIKEVDGKIGIYVDGKPGVKYVENTMVSPGAIVTGITELGDGWTLGGPSGANNTMYYDDNAMLVAVQIDNISYRLTGHEGFVYGDNIQVVQSGTVTVIPGGKVFKAFKLED